MLNLVSLIIGVVALMMTVIAFVPLLGALNWLIVPFSVIGLAIGALSAHRSGRRLNAVVIVIGVLRLILGHGIF